MQSWARAFCPPECAFSLMSASPGAWSRDCKAMWLRRCRKPDGQASKTADCSGALRIPRNMTFSSQWTRICLARIVLEAFPLPLLCCAPSPIRLEHILPFGPEILCRISSFVPGRVYTLTSPV